MADKKGKYKNADEFITDLLIVQESLQKNQGRSAVDGDLRRLIVQAKAFRFFLARLDFRDHASKVHMAIEELLGPHGLESEVLINKIAASSTRKGAVTSSDAKDILAQFKTFRQLKEQFDPDIVDAYILSMTQTPTDMLALLYLAKNEGLVHVAHKKVKKALMGIVPLFETIQALQN